MPSGSSSQETTPVASLTSVSPSPYSLVQDTTTPPSGASPGSHVPLPSRSSKVCATSAPKQRLPISTWADWLAVIVICGG